MTVVLATSPDRHGPHVTRSSPIRRRIRWSHVVGFDDAPFPQGIAFGGFNVVDIQALSAMLTRPVLVVCSRGPDRALIRATLRHEVRGGERKWRAIERAGEPSLLGGLYVQCAGVGAQDAAAALRRHAKYVRRSYFSRTRIP